MEPGALAGVCDRILTWVCVTACSWVCVTACSWVCVTACSWVGVTAHAVVHDRVECLPASSLTSTVACRCGPRLCSKCPSRSSCPLKDAAARPASLGTPPQQPQQRACWLRRVCMTCWTRCRAGEGKQLTSSQETQEVVPDPEQPSSAWPPPPLAAVIVRSLSRPSWAEPQRAPPRCMASRPGHACTSEGLCFVLAINPAWRGPCAEKSC